jgi:hypothetical protein
MTFGFLLLAGCSFLAGLLYQIQKWIGLRFRNSWMTSFRAGAGFRGKKFLYGGGKKNAPGARRCKLQFTFAIVFAGTAFLVLLTTVRHLLKLPNRMQALPWKIVHTIHRCSHRTESVVASGRFTFFTNRDRCKTRSRRLERRALLGQLRKNRLSTPSNARRSGFALRKLAFISGD